MKKLLLLALALIMVISLAACGEKEGGGTSGTNDMPSNQSTGGENSKTPQGSDTTGQTNEIIRIGNYDWRVLAKEDGKALVITVHIIEERLFGEENYKSVIWEQCPLRAYLNGEFYNVFSNEEKSRIHETHNTTANNAENPTAIGGEDTVDKVFLLSVEEAEKYFIDDKDRAASGMELGIQRMNWSLRSPGPNIDCLLWVGTSGAIIRDNNRLKNLNNGIRPAMWITL